MSQDERSRQSQTPKQGRREKRWAKALPFDQLPTGRQIALRVVDGVEDAVLVLHIAILGFVAFVHLVAPTRGFLLFIAGYETFVRDYWLIERMEHGEYGMWPGILTALGIDAFYMVVLVLPAVLPFVIARHYIVRDQQRLKDVLVEYVLLSGFLLLAVYVVGSIAGTFFVLIAGGLGGVFADVGGLLAPVGSGILLTDLLFATTMWWIDRGSAPRGMSRLARVALGLVGAVVLIVGVQALVTVRAHVESKKSDGLVLFVSGKRIEHEGKDSGSVRKVSKVTRKLDLKENALVADRDRRLYFYAAGQPLFMSREPFYHSPPDEIWLEGLSVHLGYALHPWTGKPKRAQQKVTLRPDEGKSFYDQYRHVIEDERRGGFSVEVRPIDVSEGLSVGLVTQGHEGEGLYLLVNRRAVRLYEIATPVVELARHDAKSDVKRVGMFTTYMRGAVLTLNGLPLWVLNEHVPAKVGPAMLRKPKLKPDDKAVFEAITFVAPELSHGQTRRSLRIITPPI